MSEAERKRRLEYRKNRQRWILYLSAILAAFLIIALVSSILTVQFGKSRYIDYSESSRIDYGVYVKQNDFYEGSYLGKDYEYVASLIDKVAAEMIYTLYVNSYQDVEYQYSYRVDAILEIVSKTSGKTIYSLTDEIVPLQNRKGDGKEVLIRENVLVDYVKYNEVASAFIEKYGLKETEANIVVQMSVDVKGRSEEFNHGENNTDYIASLSIPLTTKTVDVRITSDTPICEGKLLAHKNSVAAFVFRILAISFAILSALLAAFLICFVYLTRNTDITYEIKVKRLLRSYKSYIQQLMNSFDTEGYQILQLHTFNEMLEVRDIIQSPILMSENEDKTRTEFLIPTNTKLLYLFEIKVDDYEEIYAEQEPVEEVEEIEEPVVVEEVVVLDESVNEEVLNEALAQSPVVLSEIDFVMDDDDDFLVAPEEEGVEVIGVVWPEKAHKNKVYRYDPNGEELHEGDTVLVPTRDVAKNREIVRQAAVAHANHRVDPEHIKHPLKKIIGVIKRKAESLLSPEPQAEAEAPVHAEPNADTNTDTEAK